MVLHKWVIAKAIDKTIQELDELPKDFHQLLSILLETGTELGFAVSEATNKKLDAISGTTKTAKLAKKILKLKPDPSLAQEIVLGLLEILVERGERWAGKS